jgi:MFS superfamily sulfate permease-like transporter
MLSLAHGVYIVARPPSTELLRLPGTTIWWPRTDASGEHIPGVLVFAPAAPIMFTNGQYIVRRLRAILAAAPQPVRLVILEGSGVIDVDYTGAHLICAAIADLHAQGITVAIARFEVGRAQNAVMRTGVIETLGADRTFKSVHEAFEALKGCLC